MPPVDRINLYGLLMLAGILLTAWIWGRFARRGGRIDGRLTLIYFAGLFGALVGAKVAFLAAEGWHYHDNWLALLSGRSITGGLLGGYLAVEVAKRWLGYARTTGDLFALVVPVGLALGRIGCLLHGCCLGTVCETSHWWTVSFHDGLPRWPSAIVELLFNAGFVVWALVATRRGWLAGNRFHVYLIAYGLFRFGHEFLRERIEVIGPLGGYHLFAVALVGLGAIRFIQRTREPTEADEPWSVAERPRDVVGAE